MNAWVFRHLDELQRIYGDDSASSAQQSSAAGCVQVLDPVAQQARGSAPGPIQELAQAPAPGGKGAKSGASSMPRVLVPGSVIRCETEDGPDVILAPAKRQHRPRR